jgi:NAD(P)-dependent dehydrogenase (short-subunit alcohol dehydrogenase family)
MKIARYAECFCVTGVKSAYMTNIVVTGASRGLGLALTRGLAKPGDRAWLISRTEPPKCEGLSTTWIPLDLSAPEQLCKASLDAIGEEPIHLLVYNAGIWEAEPFAASKFGLRGAAHALREHFREAMVRVTCINPGWFSMDAPQDERTTARNGNPQPIPIGDIVELVRCISRLSAATCVKELVVSATTDRDV